MKTFVVHFTVETGGLLFQEKLGVVAADKKAAKETFNRFIGRASALKGEGDGSHAMLYDLSESRIVVRKVE